MKVISEQRGLALVFESEEDFNHHVQNLIGFKNSIEHSNAESPYVYFLHSKEGMDTEEAEDKIEEIRQMFATEKEE